MNPSPEITALICTFNRSYYLRMVLDTLSKQSISSSRFEVVIIDDGSNDKTKQVSAEYQKRLPIRYFYQENSGLAAAKNHGISVARAPIIVFMDDDDVADSRLLEEHLSTHKKFPWNNYAVLGHTNLDWQIVNKPLMHFVTQVGCQLFAYPRIKNRDILGYTHFWGGRSSCKKEFLEKHGIFNPVFRFGCEDIELGYRLSKWGLRVVYNAKAKTTMVREIKFDDFVRRLIKQGESQYIFSEIHRSREVQEWCEVIGATKQWNEFRPMYERIVAAARHLDNIANTKLSLGLNLDEATSTLLHSTYWQAFRLSKIKGIIGKMSVAGEDDIHDYLSGLRSVIGRKAASSDPVRMKRLRVAYDDIAKLGRELEHEIEEKAGQEKG